MNCPKCGTDEGWIGPRFESIPIGGYPSRMPFRVEERLRYLCKTCGYSRFEPTKDVPPPLPPPPNRFVGYHFATWPIWRWLFGR
jgi:hypothetical protein